MDKRKCRVLVLDMLHDSRPLTLEALLELGVMMWSWRISQKVHALLGASTRSEYEAEEPYYRAPTLLESPFWQLSQRTLDRASFAGMPRTPGAALPAVASTQPPGRVHSLVGSKSLGSLG